MDFVKYVKVQIYLGKIWNTVSVQYVILDGQSFSKFSIDAGVPQGSVLDPILF